jgi:uncharacterized protein YycO
MWNVKAKVVPVIAGATGTLSKSIKQYPSNIPGEQEIKELQKKKKKGRTGHRTHSAGSADVKVHNTFHGRNGITCSANCKYRTAATLHTLDTRFVSGT